MVAKLVRKKKSEGGEPTEVKLIGSIVKMDPKVRDVACQTNIARKVVRENYIEQQERDELEKQVAINKKLVAELMSLRKKNKHLEAELMATQHELGVTQNDLGEMQCECEFWMERALPEDGM